jgi:hypothetical protein
MVLPWASGSLATSGVLVGRPGLNARSLSVEDVGCLSPGQGVTATFGSGTLSRTEP